MVFPIADDNTDRTITPFVNYLLIAANIFVFIVFQKFGQDDRFTYAWATVPQEILTGRDYVDAVEVRDPLSGQVAGTIDHQPLPPFIPVYITLFTSMFMHGGIGHIFGNMLFLWIFGDNVEDALGHLRYLIFYLICGVLASLAHVLATYALQANPLIPALGASGAISAVLGAYLILHPRRQVTVIMLRFLTQVPAFVAIGIWFLFQLVNGLGMLGGGSQRGGGVAYGAHIGGFLAGAALIQVATIGRDTKRWQQSRHSWPQRRGW
jgi:rhomboid family protein